MDHCGSLGSTSVCEESEKTNPLMSLYQCICRFLFFKRDGMRETVQKEHLEKCNRMGETCKISRFILELTAFEHGMLVEHSGS